MSIFSWLRSGRTETGKKMADTLDKPHHSQKHHDCIVYYTNRDLILYAMGIGCDPQEENELKYLYEHYETFSAFPLFPLALSFRAITRDKKDIMRTDVSSSLGKHFAMPSFPPPSMSISALDRLASESNSMLVHLGQKLWINEPFPTTYIDSESKKHHHMSAIPILTSTKVVSIQPKRKGLLVIAETEFSIPTSAYSNRHVPTQPEGVNPSREGIHDSRRVLATSQSITLYILPSKVTDTFQPFANPAIGNPIPNESPPTKDLRRNIIKNKAPNTIQSHDISSNQAFLYRLSGDSNPLHVLKVPSDKQSSLFGGQPILHGLCTLGYATRSVLSYCNGSLSGSSLVHKGIQKGVMKGPKSHSKYLKRNLDWDLTFVDCHFVNPLFVGECIEVFIWDVDSKRDGTTAPNVGESFDRAVQWILFQVRKKSDGTILVDNGVALMKNAHAAVQSKL